MTRWTDHRESVPIEDREQALAFLYGRINYEHTAPLPYRSREFKLDRMRQLVAELGNPERRFRVVHVAGTKGKGSTSAMLARVLRAAGYRTGLYSSPHLDRIEERWTIDGQLCSEPQLVQLMQTLAPVVQRMDRQAADSSNDHSGPTYFEVTTAAAMLHFAREQVDIAVVEVGLGGRLDSTNVCIPEVSVITSISFDHTRQLGNTLAAIAGEKSGIIKPGVPIVTGVTQTEPREVIERIARERQSSCYVLGSDFFVEHRDQISGGTGDDSGSGARAVRPMGILDYRESAAWGGRQLEQVYLGLCGRHQAENAGVALAALRMLQRGSVRVSEAAIREGLAAVNVPARFEVFAGSPTVIVDAAHNVASIAALLATLESHFPNRTVPRVLVFATSVDKDVAGMLTLLLERFDRIILTRYLNNPRFVAPDQLLRTAKEIAANRAGPMPELVTRADPASAWATVADEVSRGVVCIAGSFFLASEMRQLIQGRADLPAVGVG